MKQPRPAPFPFTKIIIIVAGAMIGISFFALSLVGSRVRTQSTHKQAQIAQDLAKAIDAAQEKFKAANGRYSASILELGGAELLPERSLLLFAPPASCGPAPWLSQDGSRFHEQARVADALQSIETFGREDCPDLRKGYVIYIAGHPEGQKSLAAHIWRLSEGGQLRQIMP